jgi:hypothetical protein
MWENTIMGQRKKRLAAQEERRIMIEVRVALVLRSEI